MKYIKITVAVLLIGSSHLESHAQAYRDADGDGLIDINFIEQLDSMRYNLTGTCSPSTCNGYELRRNLNFNTAASYRSGTVDTTYTTGSGWSPINGFAGTFHGNDSTISNLFINRSADTNIGFFGIMSTSETSIIRNVGLLSVNITGYNIVGGLVGTNIGTVTRCFTTGSVRGASQSSGTIGGFAGKNGTIFGNNGRGFITESYANVSVEGYYYVGGFVGINDFNSTITRRCYATGNVISFINYVGGFAGYNSFGIIDECYASGLVRSDFSVGGGFLGTQDYGTINNVFWNNSGTTTTGIEVINSSPFITTQSTGIVGLPADAFNSNGFENYPQNITFTLSPSLKTYGDTLFTITPAIASSRLAVQYSSSNTAIASINGTSVTINGGGTVSIIAYQTGNTDYASASRTQILTVNQASQSITFGILPLKTFGDGAFTLTATASSSLAVAYSSGSTTIASINGTSVTINGVGTVSITAYQTGNANYSAATSVSRILTVNQASQSINFALSLKTFGDRPFKLTASVGGSLTVTFSSFNNSVASVITGDSLQIHSAGTVQIMARHTGDNNYLKDSVVQIFTVQKAKQSINFALSLKTFGDRPFKLTASVGGSLTVTFSSFNNSVASVITGDSLQIHSAGTVQIMARHTGDNNYLKDSVVQIFTVQKAKQSINFALSLKTFGDRPFKLTASVGGSLTVTFSSFNNSVASVITGDSLQIHSAGTVQIMALHKGDNNYLKDSVVQIFTVQKAKQSINFALSLKTFGDTPFKLTASVGGSLTVTFSSFNNSVASVITGDSLQIHSAGTVQIMARHTGDNNYLKDSVIRIFTVANSNQRINFVLPLKTFGDRPFKLTASVGGSLTVTFSSFNNSVASVITGDSLQIHSAGTVQIMALHTGDNNYLKDSVVQIFTVQKAKQSINFALSLKTFGDTPFKLTASVGGSLTVTFSSFNNSVASVITGDSLQIHSAGTVQIMAFHTGDNNYLKDSVVQIFTVQKAKQSINFALPLKTFGDTPFKLTASVGGSLTVTFSSFNNSVASVITGDSLQIHSAGTVQIMAFHTGDNNYLKDSVIRIFTVENSNQRINFVLPLKTFGDRPFKLTASVGGSLTVTFSSFNNSVASVITGDSLQIHSAGTVQIMAFHTGDNNYLKDSVVQIFTVRKASHVISFETLPLKTYGDGRFKISAYSSSSLPLSFTSSNTALVNIVGNDSLQIHGSGTVIITASQTGNGNYNPSMDVTQSFTIGYKDIVNPQKIGQIMSFSLIPHLTVGQTITLTATTNSSLPVYFVSENAKVTITGNILRADSTGTVNITAIQGGNIAYNPTTSTQNIIIYSRTTVNKMNQIINFESIPNLTVGNTYVLQANASSSLLVTFLNSNTQILSINKNTITVLNSGIASITAIQEGNELYNPVTVSQIFILHSIGKRNQSISFSSIPDMTVGKNTHQLEARASSSLPITFITSNGNVTINNTIVKALHSGITIISATQPGNQDYNPAIVSYILLIYDITKQSQSISLIDIPNLTVGEKFILTATASSSLPVTFISLNDNCSLYGNTITALKSGLTTIVATQAGNDFYNPITTSLTVKNVVIYDPRKLSQNITFEPIPRNLTIGQKYILTANVTSLLPITFDASNNNVRIDGNTLTILNSGITRITASQEGDIVYNPALVWQDITIYTSSKINQIISLKKIPNLKVTETYTLSASTSSLLPITFTSSHTNILINGNIITALSPGVVIISANQAGDNIYNPATISQNVIIYAEGKKTQKITIGSIQDITVDQKFVLTATSTSGLSIIFRSSNTNIILNKNTVTALSSGVILITAIQEGNEEYNPTIAQTIFTITDPTKRYQVVTFEPSDFYTRDHPHVLNAVSNSNSNLLVKYFTSDDSIASVENSTLIPIDTGKIIISAYQEGNEEYNPSAIVSKPTQIIATKLLQFITFSKSNNKNVNDAPFILSATSTSLLKVLYSTSSTIINIKENTVTIKAGGLVEITAYQPGNNIYNEAVSVVQFLTIHKLTQSINFPVIPTKTMGDLPFKLFATASSLLTVSYSSSNSTIASIVGNTVVIKNVGTVQITAYQLGDNIYQRATCSICSRILTISEVNTTHPLTPIEKGNPAIRIYPNPANDYITIQTDKTQIISSVQIYDITGASYELSVMSYELGLKVDVRKLPKGEYVIIIYGEKEEILKTEKVIIH